VSRAANLKFPRKPPTGKFLTGKPLTGKPLTGKLLTGKLLTGKLLTGTSRSKSGDLIIS
jgi:hypothetical protein